MLNSDGMDDVAQAYRWMWLAIVTLGIGAIVAFAKVRRLDAADAFAAAHRRHIRRSVAQCGALFAAGVLLSATAAGVFVQAAALAWYLYRYANGVTLAEDRLAP